jgi:hypothetical protein
MELAVLSTLRRRWIMEDQMDKTPVSPIFLGILIGAIIGSGIGLVNGNTIYGMQLGSMSGLLIGWFIAVNPLEKRN